MNSQQRMKERQREARQAALKKLAMQIAAKEAAKGVATAAAGEAAGQAVGNNLGLAANAYSTIKTNWEDWGDDVVHGRATRQNWADAGIDSNSLTGQFNTYSKILTGKTLGQNFLGNSATALEGDILKALQARDVQIAGLGKDENGEYIEPKDETRSRAKQLQDSQANGADPDFVGEYTDKDGNKKWVNNKWLASGNEKDLTPEDIWGYSQFYAYDPTWVSGHSEDYRRGYAQDALDAGAIDEHHGTIDIDMDKFQAYMKEKYKDGAPDYWENMDESKLPTYYQDQIKKQEEEQKRKEEEEREKKEREERTASGQ